MDIQAEKPSPTDSPEAARRRTRHRWATRIVWANGIIFVVTCLCGWLLDWLGRDDIGRDYIIWIVLATVPLFLVGTYVLRRFRRTLELAERRDRAAETRSSELRVTPLEPPIYPTRRKDSPETARIRAQHRRNVRGGLPALVVFVAAWILVLIDVAVVFAMLAILVSAIVIIVVLVRDFRRGSQSKALAEAMQRDQKAQHAAAVADALRNAAGPILYLRSFSDDERASTRHGALTEEEHLARALAWIGPLVAVGRPGERLPQVGAQRIYLTDDTWQARISELMKSSAMVVMRTGTGTGFHWELMHALSTLEPQKLLVVVDSRKELRALLDTISRHLGRARAKVSCRGKSIGTVKGFVLFDSGWSPRVLRLRRGTFRAFGEDGSLAGRFVLSLAPLFDLRGIAYRIPPLSRQKIFWLCFVVVWALAIAVGDYLDDRMHLTPASRVSTEATS